MPLVAPYWAAVALLERVAASSLEEGSLGGGLGTCGVQEGACEEGAVLVGSGVALVLCSSLQCPLVQQPAS